MDLTIEGGGVYAITKVLLACFNELSSNDTYSAAISTNKAYSPSRLFHIVSRKFISDSTLFKK